MAKTSIFWLIIYNLVSWHLPTQLELVRQFNTLTENNKINIISTINNTSLLKKKKNSQYISHSYMAVCCILSISLEGLYIFILQMKYSFTFEIMTKTKEHWEPDEEIDWGLSIWRRIQKLSKQFDIVHSINLLFINGKKLQHLHDHVVQGKFQ